MNICMFTNTYLPHVGGVARSVATFAADLWQKGHQVLIIAPTYPAASASEDKHLGVFRVPAIQNFNGSDFSVRLPLPYLTHKQIDQFKPDIMHSHHPFLLGDTALRTSRSRGLPLVFTHHTLYEDYTHYVPFDSEILKSFIIQLSTEYANLCHGVIAPSRSVAELLRKRGVFSPVAEIPTGIDVDFFSQGQGEKFRREHRISPDTALVGHVGRLAAEKNLPYLARAVALYLRRNPNCRFLVVGGGDAEKEIGQIFSAAKVSPQVTIVGPLQHKDLADAYRAMDLFVFASQSETQGLVLVEAMAAGTPVIALDASGAREVVEEGRNGRLLPDNTTVEDYAAAIGDFFHNRAQAEELRRHTLPTARLFSRTSSADRLIAFYEETIRQCGDCPPEGGEMSDLISVMQMLKTEWQLLNEKMTAALHAATDTHPDREKQ